MRVSLAAEGTLKLRKTDGLFVRGSARWSLPAGGERGSSSLGARIERRARVFPAAPGADARDGWHCVVSARRGLDPLPPGVSVPPHPQAFPCAPCCGDAAGLRGRESLSACVLGLRVAGSGQRLLEPQGEALCSSAWAGGWGRGHQGLGGVGAG